MDKFNVRIMKDSSEAVDYDERGIPVYIQTRALSDYVNMRSFPHWHEEIEFMYIISGILDYHVNGKSIILKTNDCAIVNSRQINYSSSVHQQDCTFACILFHPSLFTGNQKIYDRCVAPIIHNPDFEYFYYPHAHPFHEVIATFMKSMIAEKSEHAPGYELRMLSCMLDFWIHFIDETHLLSSGRASMVDPSFQIYQNMLAFIHQHYMDKITLADIAAAGNVCRSKCCQIFKNYLGSSPVDFLNRYRLEISYNLLSDKSLSITDISVFCGFSQPSYYTQFFRSVYGYTPSEFRKSMV